jgi:hypothetical protein
VPVADTPVNEFLSHDVFFLGGFPYQFLLGQGVPLNGGPLTSAAILHLLLQYDGRFAKCASCVFALFNQLQRHAAAKNVSLRVKGRNKSLQQFVALVSADNFRDKLERCLATPLSAEAVALSHLIASLSGFMVSSFPW